MVNIPVDVDAIAESLGMEVWYEELGQCSGFYVIAPDGSHHICINSKHARQRQRFTLGHEICHHLKPITRGNGVNTKPSEYNPGKERECDAFAAELLMPEDAVRLQASKTGHVNPYRLAKYFNVGITAMRVRLHKLGLL